MLNELIFFEVRIFRTFCEKLQVSSADTNKLFETYGIWKYIEDTYDMLRLNSDECAVKDILVMLKVKGIKLEGKICNKPETVNDKISEQERFCADLILTDAIMDMADEALYDFETGLWETGPDYFRYFYKTWSINE